MPAVREGVYNALIHCNWADNIPIQIRIEEKVMYISNSCLLPFDWTPQMLMESHASRPFNPDIARVFYRAGYIENRGRGIQKICDACAELGAPPPEYIVHGEDIMLKFTALESALIDRPKAPNRHDGGIDVGLEVGLADKILRLMETDPTMTMAVMAEKLDVTQRTIEREVKKLRENGDIERIGGKRYGHWKVNIHTSGKD